MSILTKWVLTCRICDKNKVFYALLITETTRFFHLSPLNFVNVTLGSVHIMKLLNITINTDIYTDFVFNHLEPELSVLCTV